MEKVKFWTEGVPVEEQALRQIESVARLPVVHGHLAIMPDVHLGKGATVGSVIPTKGAIIPSAVGVDIGCGMIATKTQLTANDLPDSLMKVRSAIEQRIPLGAGASYASPVSTFHAGLFGIEIHRQMKDLRERSGKLRILERLKDLNISNTWNQLGSLGSGNHFIELCLDENQDVWIMLHSGSRGVGNKIGQRAINDAKEYALREGISLPDKDLAWLVEDTSEFKEYVEGLSWAQDYAATNRNIMLLRTIEAIEATLGRQIGTGETAVNCHHNYSQIETHFGEQVWLTRKGAVSAKLGELGIIPGSMGAKSFIVRGKGNADAYCSCSHGAGRKHSRGAAKKLFTVEDLKEQTKGVECAKDGSVLDEIPSAYKNIDKVMKAQQDLVEVVHTLKQVVCVKGG